MVDSFATQQLLGKLVANFENLANDVHEIKTAVETHAMRIESRISALEMRNARQSGGYQMMVIFGTVAATIGGIASHFAAKIWGG